MSDVAAADNNENKNDLKYKEDAFMANHYDKFGRLVSYTDARGNRYNANHQFIGYSKKGVHYDSNHQCIGYTERNGNRYDYNHRNIGYNKNGCVYGTNHEYQGRKR